MTPEQRAHARREHYKRRMMHRNLLEVIADGKWQPTP